VVQQTLAQFWRQLRLPAAEWREAFAAAVQELTEAALEHTRPELVKVELGVYGDSVVSWIFAFGKNWVGQPEPQQLLETLAQGDGAFAAGRSALDKARYVPAGPISVWLLGKQVGAGVLDRRRRRSRTQRTPKDAMQKLARVAVRIAANEQVKIPYENRTDGAGDLARGLRLLQDAIAEREVLIEHAPVGMALMDHRYHFRKVNRAHQAMYGYGKPEDVLGRWFVDIMDPDDFAGERGRLFSLLEGTADRVEFENRYTRPDGKVLWYTMIQAPVRGPSGRPDRFVAIVEDTTERTLAQQRAGRIQRHLLPGSAPHLEGYDLAGQCQPAQHMSGDFYDWVLSDGYLDLTLADVMGKGMGAALLMAALRTALRAVPAELGPAQRVQRASEAMGLVIEEAEGLFVTIFHARLDLASGVLRYADAGHGHWAIRRPGGEIVTPPRAASPPLFVMPETKVREAEVRLEPGDTLLVFSDGLIEVEERTLELSDLAAELDQAEDADEMVKRLVGKTPAILSDDVTVVALRRLVGAAAAVDGRAPAQLEQPIGC
jgi:PAS domain S-box-containing protein